MEGRRISYYRIEQTIRLLCVSSVLSVSLQADEPWLTKPTRDWNQKEVKRILSDSPWVTKQAVRIVPSEDRTYRESFFGAFGKKDLYWVRFTWLAEPVQTACKLVKDLSVALRSDSEALRFLNAYRGLENQKDSSGHDLLSNGERILVLLQGNILAGLIGPHNRQEVAKAFLSTARGEQIEACSILFGLSRPSYVTGEQGVERALVEVEDLERTDLKRHPGADEIPPSALDFVSDLKESDDVRSVLISFPRKPLGNQEVTVVVPMGDKIGLKAKFSLAEMVFAGSQEF